MAIDTKPNLAEGKFEQCSGDVLNLSGCTQVFGVIDIQPNGVIDSCSGYQVSGTTIFTAGRDINGLQIGVNAVSCCSGSIAIGLNACAPNTNAISIGTNSRAFAVTSLAIGNTASATGNSSTVIGHLAASQCNSATVIGYGAFSNAGLNVAVGANSKALALQSTSIGYGSCTTAQHGVAIGSQMTCSVNTGGIAVGSWSTVNTAYSIAIGTNSCACGGSYGIAIGYCPNSINSDGIAIGRCSLAWGVSSVAIGCNNKSCAQNGVILGGTNNVLGSTNTGAIIIGGNAVKLTGATTYTCTAIVPNLAIWCTPAGSGNMLCWDSSTKKVGLTQGSVATGDRVSRIITQNGHGFVDWDVVGYRNTTYDKPIADGTYDGEILGIVSKYIDANNFELTQSGYITGSSIGFIPNTTYFLSDLIEGMLTDAEPTTHGYISKAILIADGSSSGWVLPYRGYVVNTGETTGEIWGSLTGNLSDQTDLWEKINELSGATTATYNRTSPAVCTVGGVTAGTVLTGKTAFELIESILVPEICGTLTAPSASIAISPTTLTYEIGTIIASLSVTGTFNQGCINPQGCSASPKRSGLANRYIYAGAEIAGSYDCTAASVVKTVTNHTVIASQVWNVCVRYDCGVQPIGSKGTLFDSPLVSGTTSAASRTITGIYPYYWGKVTCETRPPVTSELVAAGTKVVALSTGTLQINFSSSSSEWTWLAIPQTTASKTCWYVTPLDNGKVNNESSDKYPDECQINVTSADACWANVCYKIYMSGTVGAISATLCFS